MAVQFTRREMTWVVGGVVWIATYLELGRLGVGFWYAAGIGSLLGAITVVIIAALVDESK